jgi:hypothetical protein
MCTANGPRNKRTHRRTVLRRLSEIPYIVAVASAMWHPENSRRPDANKSFKPQFLLHRPPGLTFTILRSAHTMYLCVLCGSENKQRLFPCTALTDWFV